MSKLKRQFLFLLPVVTFLFVMTGAGTPVLWAEEWGHEVPTYEIYPEEKILPRHSIFESEQVVLPKVAIIIDDIGYDKLLAEKFLALNIAITFSVLPYSPFRDVIVQKARAKGIDIMLHLPMEPEEYPRENPGKDSLFISMPPQQLIRQLNKNLDTLPFVVGVNNHMGSKLTANSGQMYRILSVLKKRDLFFIDSFTAHDSVCKSFARVLQLPFARRDVFLDHILAPDSVRKQIRRLIRIANIYGEAVGIGHPHTVTYDMLREMLPELQQKVRLVPASEIVHTIG